MANDTIGDSLEGKMDDWGPYGPLEGTWLIFSVGNPEEGHGYALPRTIDDLTAQAIAYKVMFKTGQRHAGNIPFATDHCGEVAKNWSPRYIPMDLFVTKVKDYIKVHLDMYHEMGLNLSKVVIISGHGGNNDLVKYQAEIMQDLGLTKLLIFTSQSIEAQMERVIKAIEELAAANAKEGEDPDDLAFLYTQIITTSGHADHLEHSIGAALGILDWDKLAVMNEALENDFDGALQRWPVIGGLAGFLQKGGEFTDAMGTAEDDRHGLWNSFRGLRELDHGKIVVRKEVGEMILNISADYIAEIIAKEDENQ